MWTPPSRASRLAGVPQLRGSSGHSRWHPRRRRWTRRLTPGHRSRRRSPDDRIIHTGFAALDAILGPGGLPRSASVAIRGDGSSGRTTLALRVAAEAQSAGSVVAWLDLSRSFDPVEAVARGVRLEWLVVITPASLDEGLSIAGSLLAGRSVDMLVLDLPGGRLAKTDTPAKIADRLHRLAALARRAETLLLILDAPGGGGGAAAVAGSPPVASRPRSISRPASASSWLAGRGSAWVATSWASAPRRSSPTTDTDRRGAPRRSGSSTPRAASGMRASPGTRCWSMPSRRCRVLVPWPAHSPGFRRRPPIRPACIRCTSGCRRAVSVAPDARDRPIDPVRGPDGPSNADSLHVMQETGTDPARHRVPATVRASDATAPAPAAAAPPPVHAPAPEAPDRETHDHATSPPLRAAPSPGPGTGPTLRALPARPARAGRQAVGSGAGHRREPGRAGPGRPARHAARERPSTRP